MPYEIASLRRRHLRSPVGRWDGGRNLKLPDGRTLFLGSSGTGAPYELQRGAQP